MINKQKINGKISGSRLFHEFNTKLIDIIKKDENKKGLKLASTSIKNSNYFISYTTRNNTIYRLCVEYDSTKNILKTYYEVVPHLNNTQIFVIYENKLNHNYFINFYNNVYKLFINSVDAVNFDSLY